MREKRVAIVVGLLLFILPFFWFAPGSIDIGGDGTRLYFYDPVAFIKHVSLYSVNPEGKAEVNPASHAYLPYIFFIAGIKYFVRYSSIVINIFNGIKLSVGFISIYFIVKEFLRKGEYKQDFSFHDEIAAILAGIFYTISTGSEKFVFHWVNALHSHDQIFLNPLMFLLLLRYLVTKNRWYIFSALVLSLIFSTNFAMISSPPFFAFYPLAIVFLMLYVTIIRKAKIPYRELIIGLLLFIGLHAFHLVPELIATLYSNTVATSVVFKESGVNYFMAIRGLGLTVVNLFFPPSEFILRWTSLSNPLIIILGFILITKKNKEMLLTSIFFFVTFFLVTANITHIGVEFYRKLFLIPGFSMFRNFYIQWAYIYIFINSLLIGQSLSTIFRKLNITYIKLITIFIMLLCGIGFWPFLSGQIVDGIHWGSSGVKTAMIMDPRYEQTLSFISALPDDGKMAIFPLTDNYMQVLYGLNNAAYVGPSSISFLTGKRSFAGYQNFWPDPIPEEIMRYAREKNYTALTQIFSLFNIRYIFHNIDPNIYEEKFPNFPNSYMMTSLPKTQNEYKEFVQKLPVRLLYSNGPYKIYELDKRVLRSEVYIPDRIYKGDMTKEINDPNLSFQSAFIDNEVCQKNENIRSFCDGVNTSPMVSIETTKINPTRYKIHVKQSDSKEPLFLVFQNSYHKDWKVSIDDESALDEKKHVIVNMYANGWIIASSDHKGKNEYTVTLDLVTQRYFWYGLWITGISIIFFIILVIKSLVFVQRE